MPKKPAMPKAAAPKPVPGFPPYNTGSSSTKIGKLASPFPKKKK